MKALIGKFFELIPRFIVNLFIKFYLNVYKIINQEVLNMDKRQNKYSIRKFTFGASSILIGSLLFLGVGTAQAAEEDHHTETKVQQLNGNQLGNDKQEKLVNETLAISVENDHTQANEKKYE